MKRLFIERSFLFQISKLSKWPTDVEHEENQQQKNLRLMLLHETLKSNLFGVWTKEEKRNHGRFNSFVFGALRFYESRAAFLLLRFTLAIDVEPESHLSRANSASYWTTQNNWKSSSGARRWFDCFMGDLIILMLRDFVIRKSFNDKWLLEPRGVRRSILVSVMSMDTRDRGPGQFDFPSTAASVIWVCGRTRLEWRDGVSLN